MPARRSASKRSARNAPTAPDPVTFQSGTWAGYPNFVCPFGCGFATVDEDGTAKVVTHIASDHRQEAIDTAQEAHA